jgi:hypothetical protein
MKKFEPRTYHFDIKEVGDHLQVFIPELDLTVETEPGKVSHQDALDALHLAVEQRDSREYEHIKAASQ